jgi:DNA-binding NarL/FixJ family response regulator
MILLSRDRGLLLHWQQCFGTPSTRTSAAWADIVSGAQLQEIVWIDSSTPSLPPWSDDIWSFLFQHRKLRVLWASSAPTDDEAIPALDAGCSGYCHAYADATTLKNVLEVVQSGQVWVGPRLLQRLIRVAHHAKTANQPASNGWKAGLSTREIEVAVLAANGASNQQIGVACSISERTVKAHLSSIFSKMNVTDRLQMTLRVHGIS